MKEKGKLDSFSNKFIKAFNRVVSVEGNYVNDPNDPGGETKFGISKRSYPRLIIKELTLEDARNIYYNDFWLKLSGDKLSDDLAFQVFDFAVNSGIETSIRYLQRALNVADDGYIGPVTLSAINNANECKLSMKFNAERLDYMTRLNNWNSSGKGWARRISKNLDYSSSLEK